MHEEFTKEDLKYIYKTKKIYSYNARKAEKKFLKKKWLDKYIKSI